MKIYTRRITEALWALGMPTSGDECARFADVYRAARKAGLTDGQAFAITKEAYDAAHLYEWKLATGTPLHHATQEAHATAFPSGKCAEDLSAQREGRPSRWGTPAFHAAPLEVA